MSATLASAGEDLRGTQWGPLDNGRQFMRFGDDNTLTGHGGCNRFFASYETDSEGGLQIGPVGSTKMACPPKIMDAETGFFNLLQNASTYSIEDEVLIIFDSEGEALFDFVRRVEN